MALKRVPIPRSVEFPEGGKVVEIVWSDGAATRSEAYALRVACPCAGCVDEMTGDRLLDPGRIDEDITITGHGTVGRYGLQFRFSDGHGTGIYTYAGLRGE